MRLIYPVLLAVFCVQALAQDLLDDFEPVENSLVVAAPEPASRADDPAVQRGRYLVNLLGCASCHTDGALIGAPEPSRALAGSSVGIAISDPMRVEYPAVVYPPNITPHPEAGIGDWSDQQIADLLRQGMRRHGGRALPVMPWQSYARLNEEDALAIASYLKSLAPNPHRAPTRVAEGQRAKAPYVHVGLYQRR
jgi:mono/diheme cytochrome c family protein